MSDSYGVPSFVLDAYDYDGSCSDFSAGSLHALMPATAAFRPNGCCPLWTDRDAGPVGPFWTEQLALFEQHGGMMQVGPTCVSNSLSLLTFGAARPEEFQGPASGVNTQDPVTWSRALKRHAGVHVVRHAPLLMVRARAAAAERRVHCVVLLRRRRRLHCRSQRRRLRVRQPHCGGGGWQAVRAAALQPVCFCNIPLRYDSCSAQPTALDPASESFRAKYGTKFLKRIFRVVPVDYPSEL